jgi:hypothetical protein
MTLKDALTYFGSPIKLCIVLGASHQSLYYWRKRGALPELQQYKLQVFTEGKLKIDKRFEIKKDVLDYTFYTTTRKRKKCEKNQ